MTKYEVLRSKNDWLSHYKGKTFTAKLHNEIIKSVISEHAKYKSGKKNFVEQLGKKCIVTCIDPATMELESVGASSLLKNELTGQIVDNLILDNFGRWFAAVITNSGTVGGGLTDDVGGSQAVSVYAGSQSSFNIKPVGQAPGSSRIKMGSGTTTPARGDNKIQTSLTTAPESDYLGTNAGAYTVNNTVIYQGDANPTGGTGTVNEAGSFEAWFNTSGVSTVFMLTHDVVTPSVSFTALKLLRASYVWTI